MEVIIIWILIVVGFVIYIIVQLFKAPTLKELPPLRLLNREGDSDADEWHTYIAGVPHHASKADIGGFCGVVAPDPGNAYDSNAMGIYELVASKGRLLGYIPARELLQYRNWSECLPMPCVGFIFFEDGQLRGRVKILRPCNEEFLENEFTLYLKWVINNYGEKYLPKSLTVQFSVE